jgi:hypothetical protein
MGFKVRWKENRGGKGRRGNNSCWKMLVGNEWCWGRYEILNLGEVWWYGCSGRIRVMDEVSGNGFGDDMMKF